MLMWHYFKDHPCALTSSLSPSIPSHGFNNQPQVFILGPNSQRFWEHIPRSFRGALLRAPGAGNHHHFPIFSPRCGRCLLKVGQSQGASSGVHPGPYLPGWIPQL